MPVIDRGSGITVKVWLAVHPFGVVYMIVVAPAVPPVTNPVVDPTVAMAVLPELHLPPSVVSISVIDEPEHTVWLPMMPDTGLIMIVVMAAQPELRVYEINTVPEPKAVTAPDVPPTTAMYLLPLAHTPPGVPLLNVIVLPTHTVAGPVIAVGDGTTVTVVLAVHPAISYTQVKIPPVMPVTIPEEDPIVAVAVELPLHVPPTIASYNVNVWPVHTCPLPTIGFGSGLTVMTLVAAHPAGNA